MCSGVSEARDEKLREPVTDTFVKRDGREPIAKYYSPFSLILKFIHKLTVSESQISFAT